MYFLFTKYLITIFYVDKICICHGKSSALPMTTMFDFALKIDALFHLTKTVFYSIMH